MTVQRIKNTVQFVLDDLTQEFKREDYQSNEEWTAEVQCELIKLLGPLTDGPWGMVMDGGE